MLLRSRLHSWLFPLIALALEHGADARHGLDDELLALRP